MSGRDVPDVHQWAELLKKSKGNRKSDNARPDPINPEKINNSWKLFSDKIPTGLVI